MSVLREKIEFHQGTAVNVIVTLRDKSQAHRPPIDTSVFTAIKARIQKNDDPVTCHELTLASLQIEKLTPSGSGQIRIKFTPVHTVDAKTGSVDLELELIGGDPTPLIEVFENVFCILPAMECN